MAVVLDNDTGERVLLYAANGTTLLKVAVDSSGNLVMVGAGAGGAMHVIVDSQPVHVDIDAESANMALETGGNLATVAGQLDVKLSTRVADTTLADPTKNMPAMLGYDGSAWKKQGLIWAYNARYAEQIVNLNAPATPTALTGTAVPANEVWVVQAVNAWDANNILTQVRLAVVLSGNATWLTLYNNLPANTPLFWTGQITLAQGDYVYGLYSTPTLNDDIYLQAAGYKMKIAM